MTHQQILTDLKNKKYQPIYFLAGSEPYFIDLIADYIETNVLSESEKSFNQTILYGKEIDHKMVVDAARRYPMMSTHQVVIVKEAQEMRTLKNLESYIEKPLSSTILVLCHKHKKFNANSKFGKLLKQKAVYFSSKKLWDNEVPNWIRNYLHVKNLKVTTQATNLIAEYLGSNLSKVSNELDKLALNIPPGTEITDRHVEAQIGISREYNIFELQKAIGKRDIPKANQMVNYFIANPRKNPLILIIGTLFNYFNKIYMMHFVKNASEREIMSQLNLRSAFILKEYRSALRHYPYAKTVQILSLLKEYDLKSKGVNFNSVGKPEGELLREMMWKILH